MQILVHSNGVKPLHVYKPAVTAGFVSTAGFGYVTAGFTGAGSERRAATGQVPAPRADLKSLANENAGVCASLSRSRKQ